MANSVDFVIRAKDEATSVLQKVSGEIGALTGPLGRIAALAGPGGAFALLATSALAVGGAVTAMGEAFAENVKRLNRIASGTGSTTEQVQILESAFKRVGLSTETATRAMQFMEQSIGQHKKALGDLGITTHNASLAIQQLSGVLAKTDPADRARVSFELLGRAGKQMAGAWAALPEAIKDSDEVMRASGAIISTSLVAKALDLAERIDDLKDRWSGVWNQMLGVLLPTASRIIIELNNVISRVANLRAEFEKPIGENLLVDVLRLLREIAGAAGWLYGIFERLIGIITDSVGALYKMAVFLVETLRPVLTRLLTFNIVQPEMPDLPHFGNEAEWDEQMRKRQQAVLDMFKKPTKTASVAQLPVDTSDVGVKDTPREDQIRVVMAATAMNRKWAESWVDLREKEALLHQALGNLPGVLDPLKEPAAMKSLLDLITKIARATGLSGGAAHDLAVQLETLRLKESVSQDIESMFPALAESAKAAEALYRNLGHTTEEARDLRFAIEGVHGPTGETAALQSGLRRAATEAEALKSVVDSVSTPDVDVSKLKADLAAAMTRASDLDKSIKDITDPSVDTTAMRGELALLEASIAALKVALHSFGAPAVDTSKVRAALDVSKAKVEELQNGISNLKGPEVDAGPMKNQLTAVTIQTVALQDVLSAMSLPEFDPSKMKEALALALARVKELDLSVRSVSDPSIDTGPMRTELAQARAEVAALGVALGSLAAPVIDVSGLNEAMTSAKGRLAELTGSLAELMRVHPAADTTAIRNEIDLALARVIAFQRATLEIRSPSVDLGKLKAGLNAEIVRVGDLQRAIAQIGSPNVETAHLQSELAQALARADALKLMIDSIRVPAGNTAGLRGALGEAQAKVVALQAELDNLKSPTLIDPEQISQTKEMTDAVVRLRRELTLSGQIQEMRPIISDKREDAGLRKRIADMVGKDDIQTMLKALDAITEPVNVTKSLLDGLSQSLNDSFSQVFQNLLTTGQTFGSAMKSIFRSMVSAILSELARLLAASIFKFFLKLLGLGGGGGLTNMLSAAAGIGTGAGDIAPRSATQSVPGTASLAPTSDQRTFIINALNAHDIVMSLTQPNGEMRRANDRVVLGATY